ncbi:MAG: protein kinase [Thermoanaerobaculia bacterium]|nr:protein kinase [Thermoanaerobaculia bacterium]
MRTGTRLGPYEIEELLGAGGMGEVYRARDERLGRSVAVKILPSEFSNNEDALERFRREARVLASLSHPNLVSIFDIGQVEKHDYVVMELLEGETLRSGLGRGRMPVAEVIRIGAGIARAATAAHDHGVIHRDLKPENVFLTSDGRVKVLDFGLARALPEGNRAETEETKVMLTTQGVFVGTPGYASPEQVRGEPTTPRSDVFALGCILYEMLQGRAPFLGPSVAETLSSVLRDTPPVPDRSEAPPALLAVIERCLEKAPGGRPAAAGEVADELHRLQSQGVESQLSPSPRVDPTTLRRVGVIAIVVLTVLLGLGILATRLAQNRASPPEARAVAASTPVRSLAVIPLSTDLDRDEFLVDGLTEAWIRRLSGLGELRVTSRASVFRYEGGVSDPMAVGRELGVDALLLGEVRGTPDGLVLSTELVAADDGRHLWGTSVAVGGSTLLEVGDQSLEDLVQWLDLAPPSGGTSRTHRPVNPEAQRLYLQGRLLWNRREPGALREAISKYEQALLVDPSYALAYAGLADTYAILHDFDEVSAAETFPRARAAAARALELDPDLPEAHVTMAYLEHYWEWDWVAAEREYRRALELNPSYASGWQWYGELLTALGRFDEAEQASREARNLDPLSPIVQAVAGWDQTMARRYEEAIDTTSRTLDIFPDFAPARLYQARAFVLAGRFDEAIAAFDSYTGIKGNIHTTWQAWAYVRAGRSEEGGQLVDELVTNRRNGGKVLPYYFAYALESLGRIDEALTELETAHRERNEQMVWLAVDPALDRLRDEPRFQSLLHEMAFPGKVAGENRGSLRLGS